MNKADYIAMIAQQDLVLATLRDCYLGAKTREETQKQMARINQALEERSRLMKLRDAAT
jgi:hypothetical protein